MSIRTILVVFPFLLTWPAGHADAQDADKHRCTFGELERRIEIYREPGVSVPCEVHYYKDSEAPGDQQVLWRAQSEEGYCEARVDEFLTKLADWGWDCSASAAASAIEDATPEEAPVDEAPADESID